MRSLPRSSAVPDVTAVEVVSRFSLLTFVSSLILVIGESETSDLEI